MNYFKILLSLRHYIFYTEDTDPQKEGNASTIGNTKVATSMTLHLHIKMQNHIKIQCDIQNRQIYTNMYMVLNRKVTNYTNKNIICSVRQTIIIISIIATTIQTGRLQLLISNISKWRIQQCLCSWLNFTKWKTSDAYNCISHKDDM